jgi:hypothetical protein
MTLDCPSGASQRARTQQLGPSASTTATYVGVVLEAMKHCRLRRESRLLPFRDGRRGRREDARIQRQPREFRDGPHAQLRRDRRAVPLHRPLVDAEIVGDLLVQPALHDMAEHFEFPFAERVEARATHAAGRAPRVRAHRERGHVSPHRPAFLGDRRATTQA